MSFTHALRRSTLPAACALALCFASAAGALPPPGNPPDPPPPPSKPNLLFSAASVTHGTTVNDWVISYTVANRGTAAANLFRVSVQQDGGNAPIKDTFMTLAAGASRSDTVHVLRSSCYIAIRFTADPGRVVGETNENDNVRSAIDSTSATCPTQPRYAVKAVSFHANDETGWDILGSDEPYWIFNGVGVDGTQRSTASHVFGDIDTGDTASFAATEGCMYISCAGGIAPNGMGFSVQLWESDQADVPQTLREISLTFHEAGGLIADNGDIFWAGSASKKIAGAVDWIISNVWADDFIGSNTYVYSPVYLASRLPLAGASFTDTRTYSDGDGNYTMTTQVSRVG